MQDLAEGKPKSRPGVNVEVWYLHLFPSFADSAIGTSPQRERLRPAHTDAAAARLIFGITLQTNLKRITSQFFDDTYQSSRVDNTMVHPSGARLEVWSQTPCSSQW
jgi:hypothetical protein